MNPTLTLAELEAAINDWRRRSPSTGDELSLSPQVAALAEPYARMIFEHLKALDEQTLSPAAQQAIAVWRQRSEHKPS